MDMGGGGFWKNGCPLFRSFQNIIVTKVYLISFEIKVELSEVLEGSSDEDEVEDETFGRIFTFPRPFRGRDEEFLGIWAFFSAILRTRLLILVFRDRG